jgi:hypothetical protein
MSSSAIIIRKYNDVYFLFYGKRKAGEEKSSLVNQWIQFFDSFKTNYDSIICFFLIYTVGLNMKVFICILFSLTILNNISYSGCPKMQKATWKYSVDDKKFKSYYAAKSYLRTLKKQEDGWKSLDISKVSPYRYETKWVYDTEDHGLFCVCPDCRFPNTKEVTKVGYLSRP